jgi:radical SAM superfamily enzyme YgiQ (UPF0313 family)
MNILLVCPPRKRLLQWLWPPLGLCYIGGYLLNEGHRVKGMDLRVETKNDLEKILRKEKFQMIGITADITTVAAVKELASFCKNISRGETTVVVGGPYATIAPDEFLDCRDIDLVVMGEGEKIMSLLAASESLENIPNISYRADGKVVKKRMIYASDPLDSLPLPARDLFPMDEYLRQSWYTFPLPAPSLHIVGSRGCPYDCSFCQPTVNLIFGKKTRWRDPGKIVGEISLLRDRYNIKGFHFQDDTFTADKKWAMSFCRQLREAGLSGLSWACQSRANTIDDELAAELKRSGCVIVWFGFESGSQKILDYYHKGIKTDDSVRAAETCKKNGLLVLGQYMIGAPVEDPDDLDRTYALVKRQKPHLSWVSITTAYPGTGLYESARQNNHLIDLDYDGFDRVKDERKLKTNLSLPRIKKAVKDLEQRTPSIKLIIIDAVYRRAFKKWLFSLFGLKDWFIFLCRTSVSYLMFSLGVR